MPAEASSPTTGRDVRVATSAVLDITFALFLISPRATATDDSHPWLRRMRAEAPDLIARCTGFWTPGSAEHCEEWLELPLYAHVAGTLFASGFEPTLAALGDVAASTPPVPRFPTEDEHVFARVLERVSELGRSAARRRAYVELMRDVWAFLGPDWREGLPAAQAQARQLEQQLAQADRAVDVVPRTHIGRREQFAASTARAIAAGEAVLVPLVLTEAGQLFFGLPGELLIGFGPSTSRKAEVRRNAAAEAAKRFKVLSDATRMALLNRMLHGPLTITDLAAYFELSQPTVSVHVKMLREAGLLESEKMGGATLYRVTESTLQEYVRGGLERLMEDQRLS